MAEDEVAGQDKAITSLLQAEQQADPEGFYSTVADNRAAAQTDAEKTSALLRSDPTGMLVLEYGIESLRIEHPWSPAWQSRAYTIAGAKLARDAYRILYRISSRLNRTLK